MLASTAGRRSVNGSPEKGAAIENVRLLCRILGPRRRSIKRTSQHFLVAMVDGGHFHLANPEKQEPKLFAGILGPRLPLDVGKLIHRPRSRYRHQDGPTRGQHKAPASDDRTLHLILATQKASGSFVPFSSAAIDWPAGGTRSIIDTTCGCRASVSNRPTTVVIDAIEDGNGARHRINIMARP
jgi:hypothetical protein